MSIRTPSGQTEALVVSQLRRVLAGAMGTASVTGSAKSRIGSGEIHNTELRTPLYPMQRKHTVFHRAE
jgi:hypothetical protein